MAGYRFHTWVRMTPRDGAVETLDLSSDFLDSGSARSVLTKAEPRYEERIESGEDINYAQRPLLLGIYCEVMLRFETVSPATEHAAIARLVTRLIDPYWTVELSLDNKVTYREVVAKKIGYPRPFGDKTIAGFRVEHVVACRELLDTYPAIGAGTSW